MVQQIASVKPDSATSNLPSEFIAAAYSNPSTSASGQRFSNELFRQSQRLEVQQVPRQPTVNASSQRQDTQVNKPQSSQIEREANNHNDRRTNGTRKDNTNNRSDPPKESAFEKTKLDTKEDRIKEKRASATDKQSQQNDTVGQNHEQKELTNVSDNTDALSSDLDKAEHAKKYKSIDNTQSEKIDHAFIDEHPKALDTMSLNKNVPEELADNFDYIEYVTHLAEFSSEQENKSNGVVDEQIEINVALDSKHNALMFSVSPNEELGLVNQTNTELQLEADTSVIDLVASPIDEDANVIDENAASILNKVSENIVASDEQEKNTKLEDELLKFGLSKEDLRIILDAKQNAIDNQEALSSEDVAEIAAIIDYMLKKLSSKESLENSDNTDIKIDNSAATQASDAELLLALLQATSISEDSDKLVDTSADTSERSLEDKLRANLLFGNSPQSNTQAATTDISKSATSTNDIDLASHSNNGLKPNLVQIQEQSTATATNKVEADLTLVQKTDVALAGNDSLETDLTLTQSLISQKLDKRSQQAIPNGAEQQTKSALVNIANMNEAQTQKALENINLRVQSIASEVSDPLKANEFIAALQSSVQEFKQQIASGREPGLDLKAIVNDALAQVNAEVPANKQTKIDASLGQFNAILNLANAVNYSANQQQAQVLGITDMQLAKEINFQHIEGTKLANANSQLNAQAAADKAVNIFKQEGQAQLAEKVRWMVNSRNPSAEIRLDPPDLGGINIKVNLSGDSAQVNFNVQSNAAKEALDQAIPRLREMLQESGIQLGESSVQQDSQPSHEQDEPSHSQQSIAAQQQGAVNESIETGETQVIEQRINNNSLSGIDYYA